MSFSRYYDELLKKGFIREDTDDKGRKFIFISEKGIKYLEKYRLFIEILDEFDL
ncbi:putative transcriptional regulator [Methanomicrobium sp. W14]|uniref:hypothetical protein n=1 Tax=Methanomicrobium sp. W14 TaxID=2817839 RepID=UPI001AE464E7|nr:hypothetical protein [Methanomicrobium sp. W14]MBP2133680.1 putative transcriptional regulator [Methanomicrobium sp. W14]